MSNAGTTMSPVAEVAQLQQQIAQLAQQNAALLAAGTTTLETTTLAPTVAVPGLQVKVPEEKFNWAVFFAVIAVMALLCAIPLVKPFKGCCNRCIYRVMPIITIVNLFILSIALAYLKDVNFNDIFFKFVKVFEILLNTVQKVLLAVAGSVALVLVWKFKDRIFEALGVDNPTMVIGEFRDWATCWSMTRFTPIEVFILKVEGLPSANFTTPNDVYVEISCGYNITMKTRVHYRAGNSCVLKESVQLNYDDRDAATRLHIVVKAQDVIGATEIASTEFGTVQMNRLLEPDKLDSRAIGWGSTLASENKAWDKDQFKEFDLIPSGRIWLRFQQNSTRASPC
jgi:hypothetical protein